MTIRALRGAITVPEDTRQALLEATEGLLRALIDANGIEPEAVVAAVFSATDDLTAAYPAEAARALGWTEAGLMCLKEMPVKGGLERCLRVLVLLETEMPPLAMRHIYLRGARGLRPDLD
jgi:chorismate mutase